MEKSKLKIILTRGVPASGKSTWAKKVISENDWNRGEQWIRVNNDDIRNMFGVYWVPDREKLVDSTRKNIIQKAVENRVNIIVDNMNFSEKYKTEVEQILEETEMFDEYEIEYKDFFIPLAEAIERDSLRSNPIGAGVIKSIYKQNINLFNQAQVNRPIVKKQGLPNAIIVDLDGTVANNTTGRSFYGKESYSKMYDDEVYSDVKHFLHNCVSGEPTIIFITGRNGDPSSFFNDGYEISKQWIKDKLGIDEFILYTRKPGDYTSSDLYKKAVYESYIKDQYDIDFVLEDSMKCCNMWRELGLLCFNVWFNNY